MKWMLYIATFLTLSLGSATVQAQINSPPPPLMGQPSSHLYSVSGVIANGLGLDTFFSCTNTTSANIRVGVELFFGVGGPAANDPSATSLDIPAGGARTFGTGAAVGISVSSNLGGFGADSARILATANSGIICTALVADNGNAPPTSMADLNHRQEDEAEG